MKNPLLKRSNGWAEGLIKKLSVPVIKKPLNPLKGTWLRLMLPLNPLKDGSPAPRTGCGTWLRLMLPLNPLKGTWLR